MNTPTVNSKDGDTPSIQPSIKPKPIVDPYDDLEAEGLEENRVIENVDPFDPEALRADLDDDVDTLGLEELDIKVLRGKPSKQNFFRIRPEPAYQMIVWILKWEEDEREQIYLVNNAVAKLRLPEYTKRAVLYSGVTRLGVPFLWPVPVLDDSRNSWHVSAHNAAKIAYGRWIKLIPEKLLKAYRCKSPRVEMGEPKWSPLSFREMQKAAYGDYFIGDPDHIIVKKLNGEL